MNHPLKESGNSFCSFQSSGPKKSAAAKKDKAKKKETATGGADKDKEKAKESSAKVKVEAAFKVPEHAISFKSISVLLRYGLLDKSPANHGAVSILRNDPDFNDYLLR